MRTPLIRPATAIALAAVIGACGDDAPGPPPPVDRSLFAYDRGRPLEARTRSIFQLGRVVVERVGYRSFDGQRVPGLFVHREGVRREPCVLFQHGFGSSKGEAGGASGPLAGRGISTMAIDARFHGERAPGPSFPLAAAGRPRLLYRMFRETTIDLRRALDYLARRRECDPARLGYVGGSFGAMVGALLAGVDRRVQAPALVVGGGNWEALLEGSDVFLPGIEAKPAAFRGALDLLEPLDPERWVPRISPRPVLIAYGARDRVVVPESGEALADAARDPKKVVTYAGDHGAVMSAGGGKVRRALNEWLREHLVARKRR